jgi:hypothetical protein
MPDITAFYSQPAGFTSPRNHADALAGLPAGLAALTIDPGAGFAELTARYQADPRLTVPATVYNGVLKRVDEV